MKHLLLNKAGEGGEGSSAAPAPDFSKILKEGLSGLEARINSKIEAQLKPQPAAKKPTEDDGEIEDLILVDTKRAVKKITSQVREEVLSAVTSENQNVSEFQNKFSELVTDFPEIGVTNSKLYTRAKEIMAESANRKYDAQALERAVLRAAMEEGVMPVKHRKNAREDDEEEAPGEYLGGGFARESRRESSRRNKSDKLPAQTLAFAQMMNMDVKDPKVVERLTKTYNDRKGNWNKFK